MILEIDLKDYYNVWFGNKLKLLLGILGDINLVGWGVSSVV